MACTNLTLADCLPNSGVMLNHMKIVRALCAVTTLVRPWFMSETWSGPSENASWAWPAWALTFWVAASTLSMTTRP